MAMAQLAADNLIAYLTRGQALTPINTVPSPVA
jgi:gluconate 2-dehydrogenase